MAKLCLLCDVGDQFSAGASAIHHALLREQHVDSQVIRDRTAPIIEAFDAPSQARHFLPGRLDTMMIRALRSISAHVRVAQFVDGLVYVCLDSKPLRDMQEYLLQQFQSSGVAATKPERGIHLGLVRATRMPPCSLDIVRSVHLPGSVPIQTLRLCEIEEDGSRRELHCLDLPVAQAA